MKNPERIFIPIAIIMIIAILGCYMILNEYNGKSVQIKKGVTAESNNNSEVATDNQLKGESMAILIGVDKEEKTVLLEPVKAGNRIMLGYDTRTKVLGKYGKLMTMDQLALGEILDVTYSVHNNIIDTMQISKNAWSQTDVRRFDINPKSRIMEIADSMYRMDDSVIVSYGSKLADLIDVTSVDTLIVKGVDRRVCSIIVQKGHGYLRLANDEYFIDGWIEVGQEIIKPISNRMLLPVPEGDYKIRVTNHGYAGEENVVIERDKETTLDLSKIKIEEVAISHVLFDITPNYAQLSIDGEMTDYEERVPLEYGVHNIHVELAGYETIDTNIKVASEYGDVTITMDKLADEILDSSSSSTIYSIGGTSSSTRKSSSSTSSSSTSTTKKVSTTASVTSSTRKTSSSTSASSSSSATSTSASSSSTSSSVTDSSSTSSSSSSSSSSSIIIGDGNTLYIDSPVGAQVYIDGAYVGIAPCSCDKVTGSHIFTFAMDGYITKSHSAYIDDDGNDTTLSFPELESDEEAMDEVREEIQSQFDEMMKQLMEQ